MAILAETLTILWVVDQIYLILLLYNSMLSDFPPNHGPERDAKILDAIRNGQATYNLVKLVSETNGHKAEFLVFEDALKVNGVRVNVSAALQQKIADLLNCILPTAKLYDLMWHTSEHKLVPHPQPISSTTEAMIKHSQQIDANIEKLGNPTGLKSTVGKIWIIDNSLMQKTGKACNYGWHFEKGTSYQGINGNPCASLMKNPKTGQYWYMIQGRGWAHDANHVDYSQICVLVSRKCVVDGQEMDINNVLTNPLLCGLGNHDGVLTILRQPGVEKLEPLPPPASPVVIPPPPLQELKPITIPPPDPIPENIPSIPELVPVPLPKTNIWTFVLGILKSIFEGA